MNTTQQNGLPIDPRAFAEWVYNVADINEAFSETLRDTADLLVSIDANAAMRMYQAADRASNSVQQLRHCVPKPPEPKPNIIYGACFVLGVIFELMMTAMKK